MTADVEAEVRRLVDQLKAVAATDPQPAEALRYAAALLAPAGPGAALLRPLAPDELKAAYAKARAEFDPAEWDRFDPAEYTVPFEELVAELEAAQRREPGDGR